MDRRLFPFATLQPGGAPDAAGDRAFDDDPSACTAADGGRAMDWVGRSFRGP
jgi:tRNA 2-thiocytidine biosynthesis protein TtcA